jgi:hypothetical protein
MGTATAPLTTEQLECLLDCVVADTTRVLGAYPADCIPLRLRYSDIAVTSAKFADIQHKNTHCCFIVNTHPSGAPGEHWLAFFLNASTGLVEYFDSFGLPLAAHTHVFAAFESRKLLPACVSANTGQMLQSVNSTVCGQYCVAYLYWRSRHINTPIERFAHTLIAAAPTRAEKRDTLIVARLRAITSKHPCCSMPLFGHHTTSTSPRFTSQTCCCRGASCI